MGDGRRPEILPLFRDLETSPRRREAGGGSVAYFWDGRRGRQRASLLPTIEASGIYSILDADEFRRLAHLAPGAEANVPALAFPYPGCPGYVRLRPDNPMRRNPEYIEVTAEAPFRCDLEPEFVPGPKYLSPVGSRTRLYIQKAMCPAIMDPDVSLWFVEGEKKTLAAIQSGLACIGAPGVTCFGDAEGRLWSKASGKDARRLHRDLDDIPLRGREVVICFDSDIDNKVQVLRAAVALALMLEQTGADVHMAYLDPAKDGAKQGLDDYLAALPTEKRLGPDPLAAVEETVRAFNVMDCLDDFLVENWDSFSETQQTVELGRVVKLACHVLCPKRDLERFLKKCARELDLPRREVERFVIEVKKESPADPRVWVSTWLEQRGVTFASMFGTDRFWLAGKPVEQEVLLREMALDAVAFGGPQRQSIEDALFLWTTHQRDAAVAALRARLKYRPELDDAQVRAFVRAVTGREEPVDVAVLQHFVWQVKRKVNDLEVTHHLMVILHGLQGAGKSVAIRELLAVIDQFKDEPGDLTIVSDERQAFRFARAFVIFFDEMAKAQKADMDSFKNRISQPDVSWRVLGSNQRQAAPNRATFIGATNNSLQDLIVDTTGVRRFYQVNCQDRIDWDLVNGIDYPALWASVDEAGPAPVEAVLDDLRDRQEALRVRDAVEEFLAVRCELGDEWIPSHEVFDGFMRFLDDENYVKTQWNSAKFGRRFTELVGEERKKTSNGVKYRVTLKPRVSLCDQADEFARKVAPTEAASNEPMSNSEKKSA